MCRFAQVLNNGASIFNGGDTGEIALVLSGIEVFSFPDKHLKNHYLSLITPATAGTLKSKKLLKLVTLRTVSCCRRHA